MILTAHQPAYLPWLGYFDKLIKSDIFIFLDTVQFEKNSYINRNLIKTVQGPLWLSVPVIMKDHLQSTLMETRIDNSQQWKKKHLKNIFFNYKKAPRFEQCYPKIETMYEKEYNLLSDFCFEYLNFWNNEMGITNRVVRSSTLPVTGKKSDLILNLCHYFDATQYLSGALGKNYIDNKKFDTSGISIMIQQYRYPVYPQLHGGFIPNMSILDFWMNSGQIELISPDCPYCNK